MSFRQKLFLVLVEKTPLALLEDQVKDLAITACLLEDVFDELTWRYDNPDEDDG